MGRARLKMEFIKKAKMREITFKKRRDSLIKKMRELMTLCDVRGFLAIYGYKQITAPDVWPKDLDTVQEVIKFYKTEKNEGDPSRIRTYGLPQFFKDREKKVQEAKYPVWMEFLDGCSEEQFREFKDFLGNKSELIKSRIQLLKGNQESTSGVNPIARQMMLQQHSPYPGGFDITNPMFQNPSVDLGSQLLRWNGDSWIMMNNFNTGHGLMPRQGFYNSGFEIGMPLQNPNFVSDLLMMRNEESSSAGFNGMQMPNYNVVPDAIPRIYPGFSTHGFICPIQSPTMNLVSAMDSGVQNSNVDHQQQEQQYFATAEDQQHQQQEQHYAILDQQDKNYGDQM